MSKESPTGTPRMSPRRVPLYLALAVGAAATLTAAGQMLPEQYALARVICTVLGVGIGAGIGIASPGLRKGTMLVLLALPALGLAGCATSYRGALTGEGPFAVRLSPEQCAQLQKERRTYRATESTAVYVAGAGALVSALALAISDEKVAPAISTGVSLAAGGVGAFTNSQVGDLDRELADGGCSR